MGPIFGRCGHVKSNDAMGDRTPRGDGDDDHGSALHDRSHVALDNLSDSASSALVASSKIRMRGSAIRARAMAMRWRWPPERLAPRSSICVS